MRLRKSLFNWMLDQWWRKHMTYDPEATPRAKELIRWYAYGGGQTFSKKRDKTWATFMRNRPKIKEETYRFFMELAQELCEEGDTSGTFEKDARPVDLMGESMAITLHGSERLAVRGSYKIKKEIGVCKVSFDSTWTWYDHGNLEDQSTLLDSGEVIHDDWFKFVGKLLGGSPYPIEISWKQYMSILLRVPVKKVKDTKKGKTGAIIEYYIEGLGWIPSSEAMVLAKAIEIDAVVVRLKRGKPYLRSRPDRSKSNNFSEMAKA